MLIDNKSYVPTYLLSKAEASNNDWEGSLFTAKSLSQYQRVEQFATIDIFESNGKIPSLNFIQFYLIFVKSSVFDRELDQQKYFLDDLFHIILRNFE